MIRSSWTLKIYINLSTQTQNADEGAEDSNTNAISPSVSPTSSSSSLSTSSTSSSSPSSSLSSSSSSPFTEATKAGYNDKQIMLPPDRGSSPSIEATIVELEKSITPVVIVPPTSPHVVTSLGPFSSTSLSPPSDRLPSAEDSSYCQPPVSRTTTTTTTTKQEQPNQRQLFEELQAVRETSIHPNQLKSSMPPVTPAATTSMSTTTTMTTAIAMATATATAAATTTTASSTMTLNCSRIDNDTENGINVNIANTSVAHENGCIIPESIARTTPISNSLRMPSKLIDSHDDDGDYDSPPNPTAPTPHNDNDDDDDGDDVSFNRKSVDTTPPTTANSKCNQNNLSIQRHHQQERRELASPRCQSRDSTGSTGGGRCQSDDSNCSGSNAAPTPTPNSPPVGLPLPATLPPSAAAALLPPQSAAMAAYLNAAAAAAQQNRLLLSNPLAAAASLAVQQAAQTPSPRLQPMQSPAPDDSPALDFSTKRCRRDSDADSCKDDGDAVNLSKLDGGSESPSSVGDVNSPLDLSVGTRKRSTDEDVPLPRKLSRPNDYKPLPAAWVPPINPYLAAVAAASMSPKSSLPLDWNGKNKMVANDATKALEKMSEMTRLGGSDCGDMRSPAQPTGGAGASTGRHSAWQSHWLNKGADAVKDVFKCVWCKQSFPTLATLTTHMKETQHCGVSVPSSQQSHHEQHHRHPQVSSAPSNVTSSSSASNKSDLNLLIKETMPLPRKLVRGQDVWLGKGAEQTRQILKCMWCGQSFRSLAEMTNHMQQTQHYTNIISQEQIISWKSSDEKGSSSSGGAQTTAGPPPQMGGPGNGLQGGPPSATNSTVSAVLTCKVCDQAFSSLKDLSNHMIKNAHYKEHIMRSITETGGRRRQTREKRKKSLPVRKLLELERAAGQQDFKNGDPFKQQMTVSTKITCEKCGDKIETALFVDHIRQCVGGAIANASPRSIKNSILPPDGSLTSPPTPGGSRDGLKSISPASTSSTHRHISPHLPSPTPKDMNIGQGEKTSSSPSVLNAIEQLIEKSFDTRSRHGATPYAPNNSGTPLGASILKRLGIDESVDYTKPLIDAQTMGILRSYQQHHPSPYGGRRERSGSESSSVSDRGSSRMESLTPERKPEISTPLPPTTPRRTPEKALYSPENEHKEVKVKYEPADEEEEDTERHNKISVKKEFNMEPCSDGGGELDLRKNRTPSSSAAPSPAPSPASSDRSSAGCADKKLPGSSLTALSSMFDSLNSHGPPPSTNDSSTGSKKTSSANPLAALQKLCEKTDNPPAANTRLSSSTSHPHSNPNGGLTSSGTPSGMVAFSWACNDAVVTSDSVIKCAFCDTPFCSKGAYRHHLSKVHFVKDDASIEPLLLSTTKSMMSASSSSSSSSVNSQPPPSPKAKSPGSAAPPPPPLAPAPTQSPATSAADESVQSKFLKYTELAKQLSSKYV